MRAAKIAFLNQREIAHRRPFDVGNLLDFRLQLLLIRDENDVFHDEPDIMNFDMRVPHRPRDGERMPEQIRGQAGERRHDVKNQGAIDEKRQDEQSAERRQKA